MRIVIDPGVLIAAVISPGGACGNLLRAAIDGQYTMTTSPAVLAELSDVLHRSRFRRYLSEEEAEQYVTHIAGISSVQPDPPAQAGLTPDPDDDYLVALAQAAGADYLVSGDAHLVGLLNAQPPILTPRAFLDLLASRRQDGEDASNG